MDPRVATVAVALAAVATVVWFMWPRPTRGADATLRQADVGGARAAAKSNASGSNPSGSGVASESEPNASSDDGESKSNAGSVASESSRTAGECWCCYLSRYNSNSDIPTTVADMQATSFSVFGANDLNDGTHNNNLLAFLQQQCGCTKTQADAMMGPQRVGAYHLCGFSVDALTLKQLAQSHLYHKDKLGVTASIKPKTATDIQPMVDVLEPTPPGWDETSPTFTAEEVAAIKEYTGENAYKSINTDLIFLMTTSAHLETMQWLYHLADRKPYLVEHDDDTIPEYTWRVANMTEEEFGWYTVGETYVVDSFLSTAKELLTWWPGNAVWVFKISHKARLLDVEKLAEFGPSEKEVLFLYGTRFTVSQKQRSGDKFYILCDVVA